MAVSSTATEAYLGAFMNGFEFVLLAIRGRLAEEGIPARERERLEGFLADYWRIADAYHARRPGQGEPARLVGPFQADLPAEASN